MARTTRGGRLAPILASVLVLVCLLPSACAPTVGDSFDDAAIVARVKRALASDVEIGPRGIDVESSRGYVRLTGRVRSGAEVAKALRIARSVQGVIDVTSALLVVP